ncbi:MAG TPA: phosphatase PAP2 family protein [Candidatus Absconditabacterales bacterium]|nr:phosphatase PAP2 family protein [Candidatus Absconditabacterales bacterium]
MLKLIEPQWGVTLLKSLFAWMQASVFWSYWIPILADVFVFTYPVYLIGLYIYGMVEGRSGKVKKEMDSGRNTGRWNEVTTGLYNKIAALYIFVGVMVSVAVNVGIQFFIDKTRPNFVLELTDLKHETVLNAFMPSSSFPSDHAAVTMSIAMMSLFRGIKNKDKKFLRFGGILIIFSLITGFARVSSGVHWPTDIIGGSVVGIIVPLFLMRKPIYTFGTGIAERIGKII